MAIGGGVRPTGRGHGHGRRDGLSRKVTTMSALPLIDRPNLTCTSTPEPLRQLLDGAQLAGLPPSATDLQFDAAVLGDTRKTLVQFNADRSDVNRFHALSPGLRRCRPLRFDERHHLLTTPLSGNAPRDGPLGSAEYVPAEPEFPWWNPELCGPGRLYAFGTPTFDFVEVIVDDLQSRVTIRIIS
jgi:hypothetical protein